jgi:2-iminobutanoate/2-iminopropanoate deaminase
MKTIINNVPNGPKPGGPYSLGVVAEGKFLFVSGQVPYNPKSGKIERGTIEEQTQFVLNNIKAIVETAGGKLENVTHCRVYLQTLDTETFAKMNSVYTKVFTANPPARTTVGCQLLGFDVEIDCVVAL